MAEKIRSMRLNVTFGALFSLVLGILFLVFPGEVAATIARLIGFLIALVGLTQLLGKLFSTVYRSSGMLVGALITAVGFWILFNPEIAASILPVIIGVVLVIHGIQNVSLAFVGKGYSMERWYMPLFGGIINIICGILCVACAFGVLKFGVQIIGIMMMYDGITSMLTVNRVNSYERDFIDVDYKEL